MRRSSSFHHAFAPALSLLVLGSSATPPAPPATPAQRSPVGARVRVCAPVHGTVQARVTGIALSLRGLELRGQGTSAGDLAGPVQISVRKQSGRPACPPARARVHGEPVRQLMAGAPGGWDGMR